MAALKLCGLHANSICSERVSSVSTCIVEGDPIGYLVAPSSIRARMWGVGSFSDLAAVYTLQPPSSVV